MPSRLTSNANRNYMKLLIPRPLLTLALAACLTGSAAAVVTVDIDPTDNNDGTFLYNVTVTNDGPDDVFIVSLFGGPNEENLESTIIRPNGLRCILRF